MKYKGKNSVNDKSECWKYIQKEYKKSRTKILGCFTGMFNLALSVKYEKLN